MNYVHLTLKCFCKTTINPCNACLEVYYKNKLIKCINLKTKIETTLVAYKLYKLVLKTKTTKKIINYYAYKDDEIVITMGKKSEQKTFMLTDKYYENMPIIKGEIIMAKSYKIPITNGIGSKELVTGTYSAIASAEGYDSSTTTPTSVEITDSTNSYAFKIGATGTLTIIITDDGTSIGVPIVGATLYRCDLEGNTYGNVVTTNDDGETVLNNVPFSTTNPVNVYFKQITSDGSHTFDSTLQTVSMDSETKTIYLTNAEAPSRNFTLTDANYEGLPITDGDITLTD